MCMCVCMCVCDSCAQEHMCILSRVHLMSGQLSHGSGETLPRQELLRSLGCCLYQDHNRTIQEQRTTILLSSQSPSQPCIESSARLGSITPHLSQESLARYPVPYIMQALSPSLLALHLWHLLMIAPCSKSPLQGLASSRKSFVFPQHLWSKY